MKCPNCGYDTLLKLEDVVCINCKKKYTWEFISELEEENDDDETIEV